MDPVTTTLGGVVVAITSVAIGKYLGSNGKITESVCEERRQSCTALMVEKLDHMQNTIDDIKLHITNDKKDCINFKRTN